jgi:hypothetical protein
MDVVQVVTPIGPIGKRIVRAAPEIAVTILATAIVLEGSCV